MGNDTDTSSKQAMRHNAVTKRRAIGPEEQAKARAQLVTLAENLLLSLNDSSKQPHIIIHNGDTVAAYVSMGTEVPTLGLLNKLSENGLRVLVPRLGGGGRDIGWSEYVDESGLRKMPRTATGGLRPEEPDGEILGPEAIADAELIFIPAFAIDLDGTRLGRGGGWYDRVLESCRSNALKIGVCWDWEFIDRRNSVPHKAHDIPVDAVITPKRLIELREPMSGSMSAIML